MECEAILDIQQILGYIVPPIFLFVGLGLIISGIRDVVHGQRSKSWPQILGEIRSSEYEMKVSESYDDVTVSHYARVSYKYVVNGIEYQSNTVFIGDGDTSSDYLSKQRVKKYTPGSNVQVYYDPESPENSVLEPGIHLEIFPSLGCGFIFLVFVVGYILQEISH